MITIVYEDKDMKIRNDLTISILLNLGYVSGILRFWDIQTINQYPPDPLAEFSFMKTDIGGGDNNAFDRLSQKT